MSTRIALPKRWSSNVTEGPQHATVTNLDYRNNTVAAEYEISSGEFQGKKLRRTFDLSKSGLNAFSRFLNAIGINPETTELDPQDCIGKPLIIHVSHNRKNETVYENVVKHEPINDQTNSNPNLRGKKNAPAQTETTK